MTMQTPDEIRRDLPPDLKRDEADALIALAIRIQAPPVPAPSFHRTLRRRLVGAPVATPLTQKHDGTPEPARVPAVAAAYVTTGGMLLTVAALSLIGSGPLAPS